MALTRLAAAARPAALAALLLAAACSSQAPMAGNASEDFGEDMANAGALAATDNMAANEASDANVYCDRTRSRETAADCARYEEIWEKADSGSGAISAPASVARGETAHIVFALSGRPNDAAPETALGGARASQKVEGVKVSRYMGAQLTGAGFAIKPAELQVKDLGLGPLQRWEWDATALKAPDHNLALSVYMVVRDKGAETSTLLRSTEVPLKVVVTRGQKLEDAVDGSQAWMTRGTNWLKALAALLAAALAVWVALRKFRKPEEAKGEGAKDGG